MAARRGKSQARRNQGNTGGLPGWAWMIIGIVLAVGVIFSAPKLLKSDGDGFFRPQPNPDARPPVAEDDDTVAPETGTTQRGSDDASSGRKGPEYDFYTLLPGKEVPLSDAELAATEKAEAQRLIARQQQAQTAAQSGMTATVTPLGTPLPAPVDTDPDAATTATAVASATPATAAAPVADNTRYLLQAGAFQASGQAEELKARIALLGLGARVESAAINGKTVYRVRMGPYGTASDLADAKRKLADGGLPAMAIKVK